MRLRQVVFDQMFLKIRNKRTRAMSVGAEYRRTVIEALPKTGARSGASRGESSGMHEQVGGSLRGYR